MAAKTYNLNITDGLLEVPYKARINYKDLEILGFESPDWNQPLQQNFVKLVDRITIIDTNNTNLSNDINNLNEISTTITQEINGLFFEQDTEPTKKLGVEWHDTSDNTVYKCLTINNELAWVEL